MSKNNSMLTFLAGAAVGAAVALYLKSDKEKLSGMLERIEGAVRELDEDGTECQETQNQEQDD